MLTCAQVSDTLDLLGHRHQVMDPVVVPVRPGTRATGRAVPVAFSVVDDGVGDDGAGDGGDDPYGAMIGCIDGLRPGDLVVLAAGGSERSACWGELFSAAAAGHGGRGVVCDGYVRDVEGIARLGFPAYARGARALDYRGRMRVTSVGLAVECAGVRVEPGDLVVADDDGVVVVPAARELEVLARARQRAGSEGVVLGELLGGASLRDVWTRHCVL